MTRISENRPDVARDALHHEVERQTLQARKNAVGPAKGATATTAASPTDQVDRSSSARAPGAAGATPTEPGTLPTASPFGELLVGRPPQDLMASRLGQPVGLERDLSPELKTMLKLNELETAALKLAPDQAEAAGRLLATAGRMRQGVMLALSDGIGAHTTAATKVPRDLSAHVGESIMVEKSEAGMLAAVQNAMFTSKARFPLGMDINAFVQAVLRECYLLQNEILKDYADKVKFYNDQKKRVRERLAEARQLALAVKDGADVPDFLWWIDAKSGDEDINYRTDGPGTAQTGGENSTSGADGSDGNDGSSTNVGGGGDTTAGTPTVEVDGSFFSESTTSGGNPAELAVLQKLARDLSAGQSAGKTFDELWRDVLRPLIAQLYLETGVGLNGANPGKLFQTVLDAPPVDALVGILTRNVSGLDSASVAIIAQTALAAHLEYQGDTQNQDKLGQADLILAWLGQTASDAQLASIKSLSPDYWAAFEVALSNRASDGLRSFADISAHVGEWQDTYDGLPDAVKAAPYGQAGELYAQVLCEGVGGPATGQLAAELRRLRPSEVEAFANAIVGTPAGEALCESLFGSGVREARLVPGSATAEGLFRSSELPSVVLSPNNVAGASAGLDGTPPTSETGGRASLVQPTDKNAYMDNYVKGLEDQLQTIGEDSQLANVDLQNALQQQQQTLQMMSNISKMLHDTALSIIRKIGG